MFPIMRKPAKIKLTEPALLALVRERQATGHLLTAQQGADHFNVSIKRIVQVAGDSELNINVAIGVRFRGYMQLPKAEWTFEDLNAPDPHKQ